MAGGAAQPGRTVTSRVLAVLLSFDETHARLRLAELARRSGLAVTTTHRIVGELVAGDVLDRLADGSYVVGRRLWRLGLLAPVHLELRAVAAPFMQDLYAATRQNVHLAVRHGLAALYVERVSGRGSVPVVSGAGRRLPLHATGVGKVLLAHAPPEVVAEALASLTAVTRCTITDPGRMRRELADVRRRGYARTAEEMTLGTCSVAVPVSTPDGEVVAALGLVTTTVARDLPRLAVAVQVAAASVGRSLPARDGGPAGFH